ncbi:MAG: hypothetical protein KIPDCIKN_02988 [Haliscomenobacter sp.]|nr:hypothetical protein [Haliscomenobacter sp.]
MHTRIRNQAIEFFRQNQFKEGYHFFMQEAQKCLEDRGIRGYIQHMLRAFQFQILLGDYRGVIAGLKNLDADFFQEPSNHTDADRALFLHVNASAYYYNGQYNESILFATNLTDQFPHPSEKAENFLMLGRAYWKKGDLPSALLHFMEAAQYAVETEEPQRYILGKAVSMMGTALMEMRHHKLALDFYTQSERIYQQNGLSDQHFYFGVLYADTALCHLRLANRNISKDENLQQAKSLNEQARTIIGRVFPIRNHRYWGSVLKNEARYLKETDCALEQVIQKLDEEIQVRVAAFGNGKHPTIARALNNKSRMYLKEGFAHEGLTAAHEALRSAMPEFAGQENALQPNWTMEEPLSNTECLKALHNKSEAWLLCYKKNGRAYCLNRAYDCLRDAVELIQKMRRRLPIEESKLVLADQSRPIFELLHELGYQLQHYTYSPDEDQEALSFTPDAIFQLIQQDRSNLLAENLKNGKVYQEALPDFMDRAMESLKIIMTKVLESSEDPSGAHTLPQLTKRLGRFLKQNQPDSNKDPKDPSTIFSLKDFFEHMEDPPVGVVSYLWGDHALYAVLLSKGVFNIFKLTEGPKQLKALEETIKQFRKLISEDFQAFQAEQHHPSGNNPANPFPEFAKTAYALFQQLLQPLPLSGLKRLYLLPDDELWFLPFEALLSRRPDEKENTLFPLPYLLHEYIISYHNSIPILAHLYPSGEKCRKKCQTFLGLLGYVGKGRDRHQEDLKINVQLFDQADFTLSEACSIDQTTSLKELNNLISAIDIIQVTAHGVAGNLENPMPSIQISEEIPITPQILRDYVRPNARLIVLNACASGAGELRKGEGMMAFSQVLLELEVPNIVYTLFDVPTISTQQMLANFYSQILSGTPFGQALQACKRAIALEGDSIPKDWAGLVFMGDQVQTIYGTEIASL